MSRTAGIAVLAAAPMALGQSWEFELSNPVLEPGAPSTQVVLFADVDPTEWLHGATLDVQATESGWSDPAVLIPPSAGPAGAQIPGEIKGASVTGIIGGQLLPILGFTPNPGRIEFWQATFTVTDFTARSVDVRTRTIRFTVWTDIWSTGMPEVRIVTEGQTGIEVVPAPAALALLGFGGVVASRRGVRREATR